jgi:hypothetical protein
MNDINYQLPGKTWLTVGDAVLHCHRRGLTRTAKTVRKWASRSAENPDHAEIIVRREDTDNGFRWVIEQESLDRKIDEEIAYELIRNPEPVHTGAHMSEPVPTTATSECVADADENPSEPVHTGAHPSAPTGQGTELAAFLQEQIAEKDRQIAKLNEQIERRDEQIMTMLERDRETNLLINGLQTTLTKTLGIESPQARREREQTEATTAAEYHEPQPPYRPAPRPEPQVTRDAAPEYRSTQHPPYTFHPPSMRPQPRDTHNPQDGRAHWGV